MMYMEIDREMFHQMMRRLSGGNLKPEDRGVVFGHEMQRIATSLAHATAEQKHSFPTNTVTVHWDE
jgi:hypothetical protein